MAEDDRLNDRFAILTVRMNRLKGQVPKDFSSYSKSDIVKSAVERNLQLISDIEFSLLLVLYKLKGKDPVGEEASLLPKLEGVLGKKVLDDFSRRRELRNKLVHAYKEAELDKEAFEQASNLKDVEEFKKAVEKAMGGA